MAKGLNFTHFFALLIERWRWTTHTRLSPARRRAADADTAAGPQWPPPPGGTLWWPTSQVTLHGNLTPDNLPCPPAPTPPGLDPFAGVPSHGSLPSAQPQEPTTSLGGHHSSSAPSHSAPQAPCGTAHPTTALPCLTPTSCLQVSCSPAAGCFPPLLSPKCRLHPRTTSLPSALVPCGHHMTLTLWLQDPQEGWRWTAPSSPASSSAGPHTERQPLAAAPSHHRGPQRLGGLKLSWWGNGGGCLETPAVTGSPGATAPTLTAHEVTVPLHIHMHIYTYICATPFLCIILTKTYQIMWKENLVVAK